MFGSTPAPRIRAKVHRHEGDDGVGNLPGGPIGVAVGIEFATSRSTDIPPHWPLPAASWARLDVCERRAHDLALYGELALPLTRQSKAQLALRYDDYSDFGTTNAEGRPEVPAGAASG